jgi:type IVB pilus formation R64 PilN family outer membrane protein
MIHALRTVAWTTAIAVTCLVTACANPNMGKRVAQDHAQGITATTPVTQGRELPTQLSANVAGGSQDADRRAAEQSAQVVLRRAKQPWVGSVSVPMGSGEKLPSVFQEPVRFNFDDASSGGKVGLRVVAERITAVTGVPVRVKADVVGGEGGAAQRAMSPISAVPGRPAQAASGTDANMSAVRMRWNGSLEDFLNHVTDLTNLSWEYRDGVIVIERFRTEFFEIASLEGDTTYSMGLNSNEHGSTGTSGGGGGGGGGLGSNSANADVSEKGKAAVISSLIASVSQIIASVPGSAVIRSEGSGRLAVTTTKETMGKVRDFVRAENESMLRQAQIQFDIYAIRNDETDERGIDWNVALRTISRAVKMDLSSPQSLVGAQSGGINFSILKSDESARKIAQVAGDSGTILKLLSQFGNSTQHRPVSLLSLNRQWARKASLGSKAYVSETVPGASSSTGAGAPGLKTSSITTGDRYLAQPFIMDNNTVVLKFGLGLSSLVQIANFTSGEGTQNKQTVQTPEISNLIDQSTVALKAGQLLVITGLSRIITIDDTRTLTEDLPVLAGGSKRMTRQREDFVIFVRPTIL